ncbi:MAG: hypothetical protein Ct9H300mP28_27160 [Pseudomonadota bacterium]|nr:MAG: hypothetical protein Ct9H300mP28_27160 [Pseudomonadota bacterium]
MDFKQPIIENAWGGFRWIMGCCICSGPNSFRVMIVLFIMIYALNKLLFQPVLRTLDNRSDPIKKVSRVKLKVSEEVESLKREFQQKLDAIRTEALHIRNTHMKKV